jgi:4-amino-4-deoxy-L-arabinose transferase-like glycosyltransferase
MALVLATLYLCYFHNLGVIGLVGPDEPRYAWIARDMAETGDWVTPKLYGQPWFEKPVLYYWSAALSFKLFGVSEASARLPSAVCALLATLALAWLARRVYGRETARWLLLLLPTTVGMIGFSHAAATDMLFAGMLTMAMVLVPFLLKLVPDASSHDSRGLFSLPAVTSPSSFASLLFGFFLGLATLAKGPAALILSSGGVLLWAALAKRWRDAFRCLHPVAVTAFCITALPWYILCARRNPNFFRVFIIEHNFKRFLTPEFQHTQPFWFYVPVLLVAFLPWTLALLWSFLYGAFRFVPRRRLSATSLLLLSWALFCLFFFSISKSKLPGYILPAVPAAGLLLARSLVRLVPDYEKIFRWLLLAFSAVGAIAASILLWTAQPFHVTKPVGFLFISVAIVLLLYAMANLFLANIQNRATLWRTLAPLCAVPVLFLLCSFKQVAAPWLRYDPSGKTLAIELQRSGLPLEQLFAQPMYRGMLWSLDFYLHREIPIWDDADPHPGYLLLRSKHCNSHVSGTWKCPDNPLELPLSGWFVYKVERSDSGSGLGSRSSRRGEGGSSGDRRDNRQPR